MFKKKLKQPALSFPDNIQESETKDAMTKYIESDEFIHRFVGLVLPTLITYFEEHYDIINNQDFQQEVNKKQTYLNKLDSYLVERREFKTRIEEELANFLSATKVQMDESLNRFSQEIIRQVSAMEINHQVNNEEE